MESKINLEKVELDLSTRYCGSPILYRLDKPVFEYFLELNPLELFDFNEKLAEKLGIENNFLLIASEKDIETYEHLSKYFTPFEDYIGPKGKEEFYLNVINYIINMVYIDMPFGHVGNLGLKDLNGNIIVPPLFDSVAGAENFIFYKTLCVVEKLGKFYLTPRDGSGKLISDGYDKISRSFCYAWVERGRKRGLLDSRTAEIIVPCEMDVISDSAGRGSWIIGKDNLIGIISKGLREVGDTHAILPVFDYADLATGQFCKDGKLGWLLLDGSFIERPPKDNEGYIYLNDKFPLSHDYDRFVYKIQEKKENKYIPGFKRIRRSRWAARAKARLNLPNLIIENPDKIILHPKVENLFSSIETNVALKECLFLKLNDGSSLINIKITPSESSKYLVRVSWEMTDEKDITILEAFPLVYSMHKLLKCRGDKLILQIHNDFEDLFIAKAFLSAWLIFKSNNRINKKWEFSSRNSLQNEF